MSKLIVGVLVDSFDLPKWQTNLLTALKESDTSELSLVIAKKDANKSNINKEGSEIAHLFYKAHIWLDRLIYGSKDSPTYIVSTKVLFEDIPTIQYGGGDEQGYNLFDENELEKIQNSTLDIILNFGHGVLIDDILTSARFGVWFIGSGDYRERIGVVHGYHELIETHPELISSIQILGDHHKNDNLVYASSQITEYHSIDKNITKLVKRNSLIFNRVLTSLHEKGQSYLEECIDKFKSSEFNIEKKIRKLSLGFVLGGYGTQASTLLFNVYKNAFFQDYWFLKIKIEKDNEFSRDYKSFVDLDSPKSVFWADPFVIARNDLFYLFVEELLFKTNKGHLSAVVLNKKGEILDSKIILEKPYHLSYPYMLAIDGVDYMIP